MRWRGRRREEDEASIETTTHTAMEVPVDLVPAVRELLARHKSSV
jgi:hypothetical protein